jgi:hypothetical protein
MKTSSLCTSALAFLILLSGSSCSVFHCCNTNSEAYQLIPYLETFSSSLEAELRASPPSGDTGADRLVSAVFTKQPFLRERLSPYRLLVTNNTTVVVVLLGPANKSIAWLEDASWTPCVDCFHFRSNPPSPMTFTIPLR